MSSLAREFAKECAVSFIAIGDQKLPTPEVLRDNLSADLGEVLPDVLVFECDYPDMHSLAWLRRVREHHPALPIVMITLQHSEALAVWALRNRVWDYFIKPLGSAQVRDLSRMLARWYQQSAAGMNPCDFLGNAYPTEMRFARAADEPFDIALAHNYVVKHCAEPIAETDVAKLYGMSRFKFSRAFKRAAGVTFTEYVVNYRLELAKTLLGRPGVLVADVALAVGFADPGYFTRVFKQRVGVVPSRHRDQAAEAGASVPVTS